MLRSILLTTVLAGCILALPLPSADEAFTITTSKYALKSEAYRPLGVFATEERRIKTVKEILDPESWERFGQLWSSDGKQRLY